jgi:hypothetical protein
MNILKTEQSATMSDDDRSSSQVQTPDARHALAMAMLGRGDARWRGPSRSSAIGRPYYPSDFTMIARLSNWFASAVQLSEILISTADRRAELAGSSARVL